MSKTMTNQRVGTREESVAARVKLESERHADVQGLGR
jgi:hypothetical protein